jgi:hypothetical protein
METYQLPAFGQRPVTCDGTTSYYNISLTVLLPNGVYTVWNWMYPNSKKLGDAVNNTFAGGPLGSSDGSKNAVTASSNGEASLSFGVSGGTPLEFGVQPGCALTDAGGLILVILYHIDGQTYGSSSGPRETIADHLLFFY